MGFTGKQIVMGLGCCMVLAGAVHAEENGTQPQDSGLHSERLKAEQYRVDHVQDADHLANPPSILQGVKEYLSFGGAVETEAKLTMDFMYNTMGGNRTSGTILGNVDLTMALDTEKAGLWSHGTFFLYLLGNFNTDGYLTDIVGDNQTSSNIETQDAVRLYELWYEQGFYDDAMSILGGLHDYNSEFNALEYGGLFTNSSFGIEPDISQMGPSIFPTSALALRLKLQPTENSYFQTAVYDGIPGDPDDPRKTTIRLGGDEGVFVGAEIGMIRGVEADPDYYKFALGTWLHTADVEVFDGRSNDKNDGIYFIGETALWRERDPQQGLGAFVQVGFADPRENQIGSYIGAGVYYVGLVPGRDRDRFGLAMARARNSSSYMNYIKDNGGATDRTETAIELTYRSEVTHWLTLQPDVQYIINPSMDPEIDDALVVGVRMEILF